MELEDQTQGPYSDMGKVTQILDLLRSSCREEATCGKRMGEQESLKDEVVEKKLIRKK